jgi:hypothetical protein
MVDRSAVRESLCEESVSLPRLTIPESHNEHHHRAFSQQPYDNMVALLFVVDCLEAACLKVYRAHAQKGNTWR